MYILGNEGSFARKIISELKLKNSENTFESYIIRKNVNGANDNEFVAMVQPITGGKAPEAPPITMFCEVFLFSQMV